MKGLSVLVAIGPGFQDACMAIREANKLFIFSVLSLSLAKRRTSDGVVLKAWPPGPPFYLREPIVLTCMVERNSSVAWSYSWFRNNHSKAFTHTYSISRLTSEDNGLYQCKAQKQDTNYTLLYNLSLSVTAASPLAWLEVSPDSSQHLQGEQFSLRCSGHGGETAGWTLWRLSGAEVNSSCLQLGGRVDLNRHGECSFHNITARLSGLYWCAEVKGNQRSNAINITVSDHQVIIQTPVQPVMEGQTVTLRCKTSANLNHTISINKDGKKITDNINLTMENVTKAQEGFYKCASPSGTMESPKSWLSVRAGGTSNDHSKDEEVFIAAWVWVICVIVIILLLIPITFLLVPCLRRRVKIFQTCGEFSVLQEMPRTKQDVTEIQWDLAWMEMSNLLDKPRPGS